MSIQFYPTGKACPHCIWLTQDRRLSAKFKRPLMSPYTVIPSEEKKGFNGVTIYDSRNLFFDTFNCVYGVKALTKTDNESKDNHNYLNTGKLLYGAVKFIEILNSKEKVKNVRLLINSNLDSKKHGTKEHPHALVTVEDEDKKIPIRGRGLTVAAEPYSSDTVVELSPQECKELVRSGPYFLPYITKKLSATLGYEFNPEENNFYLFLRFEFNGNSGVISGKISTDLPVDYD